MLIALRPSKIWVKFYLKHVKCEFKKILIHMYTAQYQPPPTPKISRCMSADNLPMYLLPQCISMPY